MHQLLKHAHQEAGRFNHKYIRTEHLLLALLHDRQLGHNQAVEPLGLTYTTIEAAVGSLRCPICAAEDTMELSAAAKRILEQIDMDKPAQMMMQLIHSSSMVRKLLADSQIDLHRVLDALQDVNEDIK